MSSQPVFSGRRFIKESAARADGTAGTVRGFAALCGGAEGAAAYRGSVPGTADGAMRKASLKLRTKPGSVQAAICTRKEGNPTSGPTGAAIPQGRGCPFPFICAQGERERKHFDITTLFQRFFA